MSIVFAIVPIVSYVLVMVFTTDTGSIVMVFQVYFNDILIVFLGQNPRAQDKVVGWYDVGPRRRDYHTTP